MGRVPGALGRGRGRRASSPAVVPTCITDAWWKEERGERVFIDFNQNAPHKTVFGAWSARARPGATGVDAVHVGRARRDRPRRPDDRDRARRAPARTATHGPTIDDELQSLEPFLAMHERDLASGLTDAPWPPVYPKMPGEPPRVAPSRAKKPTAKRADQEEELTARRRADGKKKS